MAPCADRKSVKIRLLEMAARGMPRPHAATNLYVALRYHIKNNHAFREKLSEVRPEWLPVSRDVTAPVMPNVRHNGSKYRLDIEEMALMGADRPKANTPEGRALYHLCRIDVAFKAMIMQTTNWNVMNRAERAAK